MRPQSPLRGNPWPSWGPTALHYSSGCHKAWGGPQAARFPRARGFGCAYLLPGPPRALNLNIFFRV